MNHDLLLGRLARVVLLAGAVLLGACAGPRSPSGTAGAPAGPVAGVATEAAPAAGGAPGRGGRYYLDDGPGSAPPPDLDSIPDAVPRLEPLLPRTARPYVVFGREYQPMSRLEPYKARGVATWYGRRYHGNPTSSGERYDMYAMTAAHPTLPIPSYARVTNLRNGRSVVVRVNDRGPFLHDRLIDLSYAAAAKLGYVDAGSAEVEVELITEFGEAPAQPVAALTAPAAAAAPVPSALATTNEVPGQAPERLTVRTEIAAIPAEPPLPAAGSGPAPIPRLERGFWLQLGAFGSADNAGAARQRLTARLTGLGAPIDVVADGGLYKLQAGPWPTREAAQAAAERVRAETELQPFATQR